jgi:hypothetical protein
MLKTNLLYAALVSVALSPTLARLCRIDPDGRVLDAKLRG